MELNNMNAEVVFENAVGEAPNIQLRDLSELQLALVGGGVGEISPY